MSLGRTKAVKTTHEMRVIPERRNRHDRTVRENSMNKTFYYSMLP